MSKVEPTQRALDQAAHDEEIKRLRDERDEAVALIHEIDLRFTSGNEVSVERARIKAHEWEQLRQTLSHTSDEGTGCVVPEAVWRNLHKIEQDAPRPFSECACTIRYELDRAIAEQGGQPEHGESDE